MLTLIVVLAAVALVVAAGEGVRGQCRRMLDRPLPLQAAVTGTERSSDVAQAQAVAV